MEPEEGIDAPNRQDGEQALGGPNVIRLKPRRAPARPLPVIDAEVEGGDGIDEGGVGGGGDQENEGDGGDGGGHGEGAGTGGSGTRGGTEGKTVAAIGDVRLVPVTGVENRYRVSFTAKDIGRVRLELGEAGDSTAIQRADVKAFASDGSLMPLDEVELKQGERFEFEITGVEPIGGRAWRVQAIKRG